MNTRARWITAGGFLLLASFAAVVSRRLATAPIEFDPIEPPPRENLVGRTLPKFTSQTIDGRPISDQALRGKVTVINIWATWCRPCVQELPRVEREIWQKHRGEIEVLAVARGESAESVTKFNDSAKLSFSLVPDPHRDITRLFGGDDSIPRTYVVNAKGSIVYQSFGFTRHEFELLARRIDRETEN